MDKINTENSGETQFGFFVTSSNVNETYLEFNMLFTKPELVSRGN